MLNAMSAPSNILGTSPEDLRNFNSAFGAVIVRRRIALGMEQIAFARMVGLSNSHLRKIEAGEGNPMLATICKLASAFGTLPSDLIHEAESLLVEVKPVP